MYSYNELAYYYDILMEDVDYGLWSDYIVELYNYYGVKPQKILDTACGTGNITIPMAKKGYTMWGVDLSTDMLSIAQNKADKQKQKIRFLNQDMSQLRINDKFDSVLCMCDGVNYIIEEKAVLSFFKNVYERLADGGLFIFDISSRYKLSTILGNNSLYQEKNNINYIWNNNYDEKKSLVEMYLVFFVPENEELYRRFEEEHVQKAYDAEYLTNLLQRQGFGDISVFDEFSFEKPGEKSERIFFAARK